MKTIKLPNKEIQTRSLKGCFVDTGSQYVRANKYTATAHVVDFQTHQVRSSPDADHEHGEPVALKNPYYGTPFIEPVGA
jgi:hypothetical protein